MFEANIDMGHRGHEQVASEGRKAGESVEGFGSFPLTVTVTTLGSRSYESPLNKATLRTVTGRRNDPRKGGLIPNTYGKNNNPR